MARTAHFFQNWCNGTAVGTFVTFFTELECIEKKGQKFRRNRSISHGVGDTSNCKFYHLCQKFDNSKWPPLLERGKFFEN